MLYALLVTGTLLCAGMAIRAKRLLAAALWLEWQETDGLSASTHTLPPRVLAQYLTSELGCEVALVGIQPADTTMGAPLSQTAQAAVQAVAQALAELLEDLTSKMRHARAAGTEAA